MARASRHPRLLTGPVNKAVVVDPAQDVAPYLELAKEREYRIRYVIDTHIHADHISGNRELAATTGAELCLHQAADVLFPFRALRDGEELQVGQLVLRVVHTPGHRPEAISIVVINPPRSPEPSLVLSGDTLFVGDVGRPDFGGPEGARQQYESVQKLLGLEDYVEVFPAHFEGFCGKGMCGRPSSTVGFERRFNPVLQLSEPEFLSFAGEPPARPLNMSAIIAANRGAGRFAWPAGWQDQTVPGVAAEEAPAWLGGRDARGNWARGDRSAACSAELDFRDRLAGRRRIRMVVRTAVDRALERAVDAGEVPGVVALAADDQGVIYEGAFGKREVATGRDMTLDTVCWIASMTKAVTSVAAMQLVEQGKLDLDEPLGRRMPELASPQVLEGFDAEGAPRLRPARRPVTLRHLLTHTAGFTYEIWNPDFGRYAQHAGLPGIIECKNATLRAPLVCDPGERWEYGVNIDWVGKAVELVSGQTLEDYFREHIFGPLGMRDTGFVLRPDQRQRLASMHVRKDDGSLEAIPFEIPQQPEFFMGGGGLYSVGGDYLTFLQMLLHQGRFNDAQVLRPETVAEMARNQIGDLTVGLLKTAIPAHSNDAEFFPGMVKKWGLGYMITTEQAPTGRGSGSLAWAGLGNTYYWLDPTARLCGVILTQILPFADAGVLRLFGQFESAIYAEHAA